MESPNRNVIVNEDDNRKLEIYTQGDLDASPSGIGIFACDANGTMRILKQDDLGNLNVNVQSSTLSSLIETLQELSQRLAFLASCSQSGRNALRVSPLSAAGVESRITTVDTVSTVSTLTNFGTGIPAKEHADDMNNVCAILSNINNVVV